MMALFSRISALHLARVQKAHVTRRALFCEKIDPSILGVK